MEARGGLVAEDPSSRGAVERKRDEGTRSRKTKADKKLLRRQRKASITLLRLDGVETVDYATQHLLITNGGLGNGVARSTLLDLLSAHGRLEVLAMPRGRPYAFVSFSRAQEAEAARRALGGCSVPSAGAPAAPPITLHLCHVKRVPCEESCTDALPPGLKLIPNYVSSEYEAQLLSCVDWAGPPLATAQQCLKHRRVQHFGYEFHYDNNNVDKEKPLDRGIPAVCDKFINKCLSAGYIQHCPDQLTVNEYQPGQGIPPHTDTHSAFEDGIMSLSLGASTVMEFRHPDGHRASLPLPSRSLLVMSGESRYLWRHGITPRKFDVVPALPADGVEGPQGPTLAQRGLRTSFTFRTVRREPCRCRYPMVCDSQEGQQHLQTTSWHIPTGELLPDSIQTTISTACLGPPEGSHGSNRAEENAEVATCSHPSLSVDAGTEELEEQEEEPEEQEEERGDTALRLETKHVHCVYEEIAGHFSSTRHTPWPRVADFLRDLQPGALICDVGCGNGKCLGIAKGSFVFGCDRSTGLAGICTQRGFQVLVCDALALPVRSGACDACLSIAVIHHLSTQERRLEALRELMRILRPGGRALVYVWALEQQYHQGRSKYLKPKHGEMLGDDTGPQSQVGRVGETADTDRGMTSTPANSTSVPCDNVAKTDDGFRRATTLESVAIEGADEVERGRPMDPASLPPEPRREPGIPTVSRLPVHTNRTPFCAQDVLVPWHHKRQVAVRGAGGEAHEKTPVYYRYYHVFIEGELEALCAWLADARVLQSYYDQGNWCAVVEKC